MVSHKFRWVVDPKAHSLERKHKGAKDLFVRVIFFLNRRNWTEADLKRLFTEAIPQLSGLLLCRPLFMWHSCGMLGPGLVSG